MTATKVIMSANTAAKASRSHRGSLPAWAGRTGGAGRMRGVGPIRRRRLTRLYRALFSPPNAH
jgi:hypothetical protein